MNISFLRSLVLLVMALAFAWFTISIIIVNKVFDIFDFLIVFTCLFILTESMKGR